MPGLSTDADAAKRQLDGLRKGRVTQARRILAAEDAQDARAGAPPPARAARTKARAPAPAKGRKRRVLSYPDDTQPATPPATVKEPDGPRSDPEPQSQRRGALRRFADGLAAGVDV